MGRSERQRARGNWREFTRWFKGLDAFEQNVIMHFPDMDKSSEEAFDASLRCDRCMDFRAGVCPGEGRQGFYEVGECMDRKTGEVVVQG